MNERTHLGAVVAMLLLGVATQANAAPVSLACADSQGGTPSLFMTIDVATGTVAMDLGTFQATVTDRTISWIVPYAQLGPGGYRPATRYTYQRESAVLNWISENGAGAAYCQRGTRPEKTL